MKVKRLSTMIYDQLSNAIIFKYGEQYPIPQAIRSYWFYQNKIDGDQILSINNQSSAEDLMQIILLCTNLMDLKVIKNYSLNLLKKIPMTIAEHRPNLRYLNLQGIYSNEEAILVLCQCSNLEELTLTSIVYGGPIETLISRLPKLRNINIFGNDLIFYDFCINNPNQTWKHIGMYSVWNIDEDIFFDTMKMVYLEHSVLHNSCSCFYPTLTQVAPLMRHIVIYICAPIFDDSQQLICLKFGGAADLGIREIELITENCTLLTSLTLHYVGPMHSDAFDYIGNLLNLENLHIAGYARIPLTEYDGCMYELARCIKLRTVYIEHWSMYNPTALRIVRHCQDLSRFVIVNCEVTTYLIAAIATEFHNERTRTTKLSLIIKGAKSDTVPEGFYYTEHALLEIEELRVTS